MCSLTVAVCQPQLQHPDGKGRNQYCGALGVSNARLRPNVVPVLTQPTRVQRQPKCSLHKLCLNATRISSSGGLALVKALHDNQSLRVRIASFACTW